MPRRAGDSRAAVRRSKGFGLLAATFLTFGFGSGAGFSAVSPRSGSGADRLDRGDPATGRLARSTPADARGRVRVSETSAECQRVVVCFALSDPDCDCEEIAAMRADTENRCGSVEHR